FKIRINFSFANGSPFFTNSRFSHFFSLDILTLLSFLIKMKKLHRFGEVPKQKDLHQIRFGKGLANN
ncbi:hypothetical protein MOE62_20840, partial [Bacillus inaquosorum]|uniref:hypothetical protein n=1 Tax=Bacillus inaquosorum TaxID=483913 RepID=UPI002280DE58